MKNNKNILYLKELADNNKRFHGFSVQYSPDLLRFVFARDHVIACVDSCDINNLWTLHESLDSFDNIG